MNFSSEYQRLAHPQAKLIPKIVWDNLFKQQLSDDERLFMQPDSLQNLAHTDLCKTFQSMSDNKKI